MPYRRRQLWRWRRPFPRWRRRRRIIRRRTRPTFWRPLRRRLWVRKKRLYFFKRLLYKLRKRKLHKIRIEQWQPKKIRKCAIKGYKCLFQAGPNRDSNNYAQYQESFINEHQPGGGGWSYLIFTLDGLWEEHLKCRNWWTQSNKGLPLCRYRGCEFKFFRDMTTDYCVTYSLCYPMLDAPLVHANSSPFNTILTRNRFIVPSKLTKPRGKNYIRKYFRPPSQLKNKWYFTVDLYKTGLLLLTTVAVSLNNFYLDRNSISNNITILSLNPKIFTRNGIINIPTGGYSPTRTMYLWGNFSHNNDPTLQDLTFLGKPGPFNKEHNGDPISSASSVNEYFQNSSKWGNPFHPWVLNHDYPIYKSNVQWTNFISDTSKTQKVSQHSDKITLATEDFIIHHRYNPDRDTGQDNIAYFVSIERETNGFNVPEDENIKIHGLPLSTLLWGWPDWQKKLNYIHQVDTSYLLCIRTKFTEPKAEYIIPIDPSFLEGKGPYSLPYEELNLYTRTSWWPKTAHQLVTINQICHSGPGTCKYEQSKSIQANCYYKFHFKWGGCPAPMIDLVNPALQTKYPVPDQLIQRLQIQDPKFQPELELHSFDERREQITDKCLERIKKFTDIEQTISSITGTTTPSTTTKREKIQKEIEAQTEEEETAPLQQQLQQLRLRQQVLKRAILQLMKPNIE
nr:MAG: ORF1 [TTV-like mini virus]UGV35470.1 MAG: ORF1 [TTV-like mini virus]UGV35525.1 MAG: ORF1 [TTV-like mini virus]UGV35554.1 MAG: ORF1 [TTV-like mini virus]UGV35923.1 MAG: ORF1 [TTV-like mini virus]